MPPTLVASVHGPLVAAFMVVGAALAGCMDPGLDPDTQAAGRGNLCASEIGFDGTRLVFDTDERFRATHACLTAGGPEAVDAFEAAFRGFRSRRVAVGGGDPALQAMLDARAEVVLGRGVWTFEIERPASEEREFRSGSGPLGRLSLLQSSFGTAGNFEVIGTRLADGYGLQHYYRDNDHPTNPWVVGQTFATGYGFTGVSLVQSEYGLKGNFEVLASRAGPGLEHFYRDNDEIGPFSSTAVFGTNEYIDVELVVGSDGDFYAIAALDAAGLQAFHRWNTLPDQPWAQGWVFAPESSFVAVSMIESTNGALEVVAAQDPGGLRHFTHPGLNLADPFTHVVTFGSEPYVDVSLFQSNFGVHGNYELAVVHEAGFVVTWFRDNDQPNPTFAWHATESIGGNPWGASMIQSNYGGPLRNFELVTTHPPLCQRG